VACGSGAPPALCLLTIDSEADSAFPHEQALLDDTMHAPVAVDDWVITKSAATEMRDMASSSDRPWVVIRKCRNSLNASRSARSTDDLP
jgi:hypothetical protein